MMHELSEDEYVHGKIRFIRPLLYPQLEHLLTYLAHELPGQCEYFPKVNVRVGHSRFAPQQGQTPREVYVTEVTGNIQPHDHGISASFNVMQQSLRADYDRGNAYMGLDFEFYQPSGVKEVIARVCSHVETYFKNEMDAKLNWTEG